MTLDDAKTHLLGGGHFGQVYDQVPDAQRSELAAWYTACDAVPNLTARMRAPVAVPVAAVPTPTGELCKCGGLLVRTGTCMTCQSCGGSSGGCS